MNIFLDWLKGILKVAGFEYQEVGDNAVFVEKIDYTIKYFRLGDDQILLDKTLPVWEDWWIYKQDILKSKVLGKLGLLEKIPARLCKLKRIDRTEAKAFLTDNHLQGWTSSKVQYGIFLPEKHFRILRDESASAPDFLIAVMTFSGRRVFKDGSISYELMRYCVRKGYALQGGFTKAFKAFIGEKNPDSVMTYIDFDWYTGGIYEQFGFKSVGLYPSLHFRLNESGDRVSADLKGSYQIKNKGSLKMVWKK